ncbi:MAG: hypothetical protein ACTSUE_06260, partial [Promethearchaeota archaeon]
MANGTLVNDAISLTCIVLLCAGFAMVTTGSASKKNLEMTVDEKSRAQIRASLEPWDHSIHVFIPASTFNPLRTGGEGYPGETRPQPRHPRTVPGERGPVKHHPLQPGQHRTRLGEHSRVRDAAHRQVQLPQVVQAFELARVNAGEVLPRHGQHLHGFQVIDALDGREAVAPRVVLVDAEIVGCEVELPEGGAITIDGG